MLKKAPFAGSDRHMPNGAVVSQVTAVLTAPTSRSKGPCVGVSSGGTFLSPPDVRRAVQPWQPPMPAYAPPSRLDGRIVAGAVLVFVGFLLQGLGWILLTFSFGFGSPIAFLLVGIGGILAAVGFLVALLALAVRRG